MEPPATFDANGIRDEKVKALRAVDVLTPDEVANEVVRAQYTRGWVEGEEVVAYREEEGVAPDSDVETYAAVRLHIDNWRWHGVPWYLRSGKCLADTVTEVMVKFKPPPQKVFADSGPGAGETNYLRFSLEPRSAIALAARVKIPGKRFVGHQRELYLSHEQPGEEQPYERLLGDALAGNGTLFTREDAVEAAWAIVDPVLTHHHEVYPYKPGTWGPAEADALVAADGGWHKPVET